MRYISLKRSIPWDGVDIRHFHFIVEGMHASSEVAARLFIINRKKYVESRTVWRTDLSLWETKMKGLTGYKISSDIAEGKISAKSINYRLPAIVVSTFPSRREKAASADSTFNEERLRRRRRSLTDEWWWSRRRGRPSRRRSPPVDSPRSGRPSDPQQLLWAVVACACAAIRQWYSL